MQPLRQQVQIAVAAAKRFERLHRRQNIVTIVAGASVTVSYQMSLRIERKPAGILRVAAVHTVEQRGDLPLGFDTGVTLRQASR